MPTVLEELAFLIAESERHRLAKIRQALDNGAEIVYQDADSIMMRMRDENTCPNLTTTAAHLLELPTDKPQKKEP